MVKAVVQVGIALLLLAILIYFVPLNQHGHTAFQDDEICTSGGANQMALAYGLTNVMQECQFAKLITFVIYGSGILGIVLIAVGAAVSRKKEDEESLDERYHKGEFTKGEFESKKSELEPKEDETSMKILKERYAKGEITKEEFDKMKRDLE